MYVHLNAVFLLIVVFSRRRARVAVGVRVRVEVVARAREPAAASPQLHPAPQLPSHSMAVDFYLMPWQQTSMEFHGKTDFHLIP